MSNLISKLEEARCHLRSNQFRECLDAIDLLVSELNSSNLRNNADAIRSRWMDHVTKEISGVVGSEDVTLNKIRESILKLMDSIEDICAAKRGIALDPAKRSRPSYQLVLDEQFETNRMQWKQDKNDFVTCRVADNRLLIEVQSRDYAYRNLIKKSLLRRLDFIIKTKVGLLDYGEGALVGVCWGCSEGRTVSGLSITLYPYDRLFRVLDVFNSKTIFDSGLIRLDQPSSVSQTVRNIEVQKSGEVYSFFIDAKRVYSCHMSSFYGQKMGVFAGAGCSVAFDSFQVGVRENTDEY